MRGGPRPGAAGGLEARASPGGGRRRGRLAASGCEAAPSSGGGVARVGLELRQAPDLVEGLEEAGDVVLGQPAVVDVERAQQAVARLGRPQRGEETNARVADGE